MSQENKRKRATESRIIEIPQSILKKKNREDRVSLLTLFLQETGILRDDEIVAIEKEVDEAMIEDYISSASPQLEDFPSQSIDDFWTNHGDFNYIFN